MKDNFSYFVQWLIRLASFALIGLLVYGLWALMACCNEVALVLISGFILLAFTILAIVYSVKDKGFGPLMVLIVWVLASALIGWALGLDHLAHFGLIENLSKAPGHIIIYPVLGSCYLFAGAIMLAGIFITCEDYDPWWKNLLDVIANMAIVGLTIWGMHALFPII